MKSTIIIAAIVFCMASCNNSGTSLTTDTDSSTINSGMNDTLTGTMNNSDTMNNSGNRSNSDSTGNSGAGGAIP